MISQRTTTSSNHDSGDDRARVFEAFANWTDDDSARLRTVAPRLESHLPALVDDFYRQIDRHENLRAVLTEGHVQIERLKRSLTDWVRDMLVGEHDHDYFERRRRVGRRHVEIGLEPLFVAAALARLRRGLANAIEETWTGPAENLVKTLSALHAMLDLDLAIIQEAYYAHYATKLQASERMATLGQIAAGIAHELRNPLNVIKTSVFYLGHSRVVAPEKLREHLDRIGRNVDLANVKITSLSNFARLPAPVLAPHSVDAVLRSAVEAESLPAEIEVVTEVPGELPDILVDGVQATIVFGNLVRNAAQAMPEGGRIKLRAWADNEVVNIEVCDTGIGIEPEYLGRLTDPLFSTKPRGLGLGLAIVKMILDRCGGTLSFSSTPGVGSCFVVRLLASDPQGETSP